MHTSGSHAKAEKVASRQVLISTLPLGVNYGGILQAFALQKVIIEMGYSARTINSTSRFELGRYAARRIRHAVKKHLRINPNPVPFSPKAAANHQALPREFVASHIRTIDLFRLSRKERHRVLLETAAIVVGSDQVWRGDYASIPIQLLSYAKGYELARISYAASFGADHLIRYGRKTIVKSRNLAQMFDHVSVREESAIRICREVWGVDASQHLDPTLLLGADDYAALSRDVGNSQGRTKGGLLTYILDWNSEVARICMDLAETLGFQSSHFLPDETSGPAAEGEAKPLPMKSVEEWLQSFQRADYVLTDSFHGTVLAIIFRKPFTTIGNKSRGLSRFESLLSLLGLQSRLVDPENPPAEFELAPPDWEEVEDKLALARVSAIGYLRNALDSPASSQESLRTRDKPAKFEGRWGPVNIWDGWRFRNN